MTKRFGLTTRSMMGASLVTGTMPGHCWCRCIGSRSSIEVGKTGSYPANGLEQLDQLCDDNNGSADARASQDHDRRPAPAYMRAWRALFVATAFALLVAGNEARSEQPSVRIELSADLDSPSTEFEGWGTALAWFAHITGGWPDTEREQLAELFYGDDGLRFNIARYNIGGGNAPEIEDYLRIGADVPGFWRRPVGATGRDWWDPEDPTMWNWNADANQRWWLDAINDRVDQPIFEAFSNSPPYFMTVSGRVSGNEDRRANNLRPGFEGQFSQYLVRVTAELERRHGLRFRTLSPINEPGTDYWYAANTQEGSHWTPQSQARMLDATYAALQSQGSATVVSGPDETSSQLFIEDWAAYPETTRRRIGQLNVHSYGNQRQTAVRDIARAYGIRLWMSENDTPGGYPEDFNGMGSPLVFAEHLVKDIKYLEPSAWVFWQAVETYSTNGGHRGTNWGLVKADLRAPPLADHRIAITKKYWVMAQFSRFIRSGYLLLRVSDLDTISAISPDGSILIFVHVNAGPVSREIRLPEGWWVSAFATDKSANLKCLEGSVAAPESVTTFVLHRAGHANPARGCPVADAEEQH